MAHGKKSTLSSIPYVAFNVEHPYDNWKLPGWMNLKAKSDLLVQYDGTFRVFNYKKLHDIEHWDVPFDHVYTSVYDLINSNEFKDQRIESRKGNRGIQDHMHPDTCLLDQKVSDH